MPYWGSIGAGITQGLDEIQRRKGEEQRQRAQQFLMDQERAASTADAAGADALMQYLSNIAAPTPAPGQASQPIKNPQIPGMGGQPQSLMPPMPGMGGAPAPQIPPAMAANRGMPSPAAAGSPGGPAMPRPAAAAPYGPQAGSMPQPMPPYRDPMQSPAQGMNPSMPQMPDVPKMAMPDPAKLPPPAKMAADLKAKGVAPQAIMAALKSYAPLYESAQRDQIKDLELQMRAQEAGQRAALQVLLEGGRNQRFEQKEEDLAPGRQARVDQGNRRLDIEQFNADTRRQNVRRLQQAANGTGAPLTPDEVDWWARASSIGIPLPAGITRGKSGQAIAAQIAKRVPELGIEPGDMAANKAGMTADTAALRGQSTRAANMSRAENVLARETSVLQDAIKAVNAPSIPIASRGKLAVLRAAGDPNVTKLDQAVQVVLNEFESIVNANPGALRVAEVQQVQEGAKNLQTAQQVDAWIQGATRIIKNAKAGTDDASKEITNRIAARGSKGAKGATPTTNAKGWKLMRDAKGNQAYVGPNGEIEEVR